MTTRMGCLAGPAVYRLRQQGVFMARPLGPRQTPFGPSETVFEVADEEAPFHLICPHGTDGYQRADSFVNHRANLYALKDLGVEAVLAFTAAGAVSHNYDIGDLVLLTDVIDQTRRRPNTCFPDAGVGVLRQFPVFCPDMHKIMGDCLTEMRCRHHEASTLAVTEGPRLETPAEVRLFANAGAQLVSHAMAPDVFVAKELDLCLGGIAYVANFAETGSRYRPYSAEGLFGGLPAMSDETRLEHAVGLLGELIRRSSRRVAREQADCPCRLPMRDRARRFGLGPDWRQWFAPGGAPRRPIDWQEPLIPPAAAPREPAAAEQR